MLFMNEILARDTVKVNGNWYIVSTLKAFDTGKWETGLSPVDTEQMAKDLMEDDDFLTLDISDEDIRAYAEEYTTWWNVEQHPNKKTALKRHKEICQTAKLSWE